MFSVGALRDPRPEDQRFPTMQAAEQYAREKSFPNRALGIWLDSNGELVAIAFDGLIYWP